MKIRPKKKRNQILKKDIFIWYLKFFLFNLKGSIKVTILEKNEHGVKTKMCPANNLYITKNHFKNICTMSA